MRSDNMTIHVRYLSQVIVRMGFEGEFDPKMEKELDRCLKEQVDNAKKPLFYLIDVTSYDPSQAEDIANKVADSLATKGKIVANVAFVFNKKKKIKNKEIKNRIKTYDNDFQAQSWLSDQSRFGFLDEITYDKLVER